MEKTGDIGDTVVNVPLSVNQITFIICGLRDLAMAANKRAMSREPGDEDGEGDITIRQENRELADYLEETYIERLQGNNYESRSEQDRERIWFFLFEGNSKEDLVQDLINDLTNAEIDDIIAAIEKMSEAIGPTN